MFISATKRKFQGIASAVLAFAFLVITIIGVSPSASIGGVSSPIPVASAQGEIQSGLCNSFGWGMSYGGSWGNSFYEYIAPNATNRTLTLQEVVGGKTFYANYSGEGEGGWFLAERKDLVPSDIKADAKRLEEPHNFSACVIYPLISGIGAGILGLANTLSSISQSIVVGSVSASIVCQQPGDTGCIDLIRLIGGSNKAAKDGILSVLTSSLYFPLLSLVTLFTAIQSIMLLWNQKFREALTSIGWTVLAVFLGVIVLLNPTLAAKAPATISSTVAACVTGSFNGENCMTGGSTNSSIDLNSGQNTSVNICKSSSPSASLTDSMRMSVNGISCKIWSGFVLNNLAMAQYGVSFAELDTIDTNSIAHKSLVAKGIDTQKYCINLGTTASLKSQEGGTLKLNLGSNKVCNLLAYQLYLGTDALSGSDQRPADPNNDPRWWNVIEAAASSDQLWTAWSPQLSSTFYRVLTPFVGLITVIAGNIVLTVAGVYALVYYISSLILIMFAPMFFLVGVHPGRGRSLMFGWVESLVGNMLKYMASVLFLVIAIAIYGGVLGSTTSYSVTLIFVIIMSAALLMYRKELVEMIGKVNMGGEQMSSKFTDSIRNKMDSGAKRGKRLAAAAAGGALGSVIAGGTAKNGMADAIRRDLSRGQGFLANSVRQADSQNVWASRQAESEKKEIAKSAEKKADELNEATEARQAADEVLHNSEQTLNQYVENTRNEAAKEQADYEKSKSSNVDETKSALSIGKNELKIEAEELDEIRKAIIESMAQAESMKKLAAESGKSTKEFDSQIEKSSSELSAVEAMIAANSARMSQLDSAERLSNAVNAGTSEHKVKLLMDDYTRNKERADELNDKIYTFNDDSIDEIRGSMESDMSATRVGESLDRVRGNVDARIKLDGEHKAYLENKPREFEQEYRRLEGLRDQAAVRASELQREEDLQRIELNKLRDQEAIYERVSNSGPAASGASHDLSDARKEASLIEANADKQKTEVQERTAEVKTGSPLPDVGFTEKGQPVSEMPPLTFLNSANPVTSEGTEPAATPDPTEAPATSAPPVRKSILEGLSSDSVATPDTSTQKEESAKESLMDRAKAKDNADKENGAGIFSTLLNRDRGGNTLGGANTEAEPAQSRAEGDSGIKTESTTRSTSEPKTAPPSENTPDSLPEINLPGLGDD